jgi:two-component system, OmpR family, sensor histidine kinase KdpD
MYRQLRDPVEAAIMLPLAFAGLLLIGVVAVAAGLHGAPVLALACVLVAGTAFAAEPLAAAPLAVVGCSPSPGSTTHPTGTYTPTARCAPDSCWPRSRWRPPAPARPAAGHSAPGTRGFWPAVPAALAAGLLLNWYFTPPVHTWTIEAPQNILALLLFVTVAVTVSSVVHLAARRSALARQRAHEAATLLTLARTVLGGEDTPQAVVDHLSACLGVHAELRERVGGKWVRVAGTPLQHPDRELDAGEQLRLLVAGDLTGISGRILDGYAAQSAAAFDRHRLRIQASQAEALAEGNRMRTALLTAVSHDLRTPLSAIKAAVTTLRQTDVAWTPDDQASLLATIEEGADRLDSLIGNLLDMSRIHTGSLQPFIRPTALDEVAPLVVAGLDGAHQLRVEIPDALPLLAADPGLLERALANLVANALRYSPPHQPPTLAAHASDGTVTISVIDHGPGIAPQQRAQVFEPFQQLGDQRNQDGVGLGLAVAKGFIEALGGRITAATTPGGGLTMHVDLPTAPPARNPAGVEQ